MGIPLRATSLSSRFAESLRVTPPSISPTTGSTRMSILPVVRLVHSATMRTRYRPFGSESHRRTMRVLTRPFGSTTSGLASPGILRCPLFLRERRSRTLPSRMPVASPGLPLPGSNTGWNPQTMASPGPRSVLSSEEITRSVSSMFPSLNRLNCCGWRGVRSPKLLTWSGSNAARLISQNPWGGNPY